MDKKEYDKKRYWEKGHRENCKLRYKKNRLNILQKSKQNAKRIGKEEVIKIVRLWCDSMAGDRHKRFYIFHPKDIVNLENSIRSGKLLGDSDDN